MKRWRVSGCCARAASAAAEARVGWKRRKGRSAIWMSSSGRTRAMPCSSRRMGSQAAGSSWLTSSRLCSNTPPRNRPSQGSAARAAGLRWRRENSREASSDWLRPSGASCWNFARSLPKSARMVSGVRVRRCGPTSSSERGWSARSCSRGSSWSRPNRGSSRVRPSRFRMCDSSHRLSARARPWSSYRPAPGRPVSPGRQVTSRRPLPAPSVRSRNSSARRRRSSSV